MPKKTTSTSNKKPKAGASITPVHQLQQNRPLLDENLSWERDEHVYRRSLPMASIHISVAKRGRRLAN